ncbi:PPE domain-containing protein [Actinophytocola sp.]|uniref:PPE domain-containing protein n=1 Tax=Actinophytocola sp. TaxID=1872138 RepID=UPI003D6BFF17
MSDQHEPDEHERYTHWRTLRDEYRTEHGLSLREAMRRATEDWRAARRELTDGAEFRDDAPVSTAVYEGYQHEQLHRMVTEGLVPSQVGDMSESWSKLANAMARFSDRLREHVTRTDAVWQGEAADMARGYTLAVSTWSGRTSRSAQLVCHQLGRQTNAAAQARDTMPEPVPFDLEAQSRAWLADPQAMPVTVPQSMAQQRDSRQAKAEAVEVMTKYDRLLESAAAQQPVFSGPPRLTADVGDESVTTAAGAAARPDTGGARPGVSGVDAGPVGRPDGGGGGGGGAAPGRTTSSMPFHTGGAGPAVAAQGTAGPRGATGYGVPAAPGATPGRDSDRERKPSAYLQEWDTDLWFGDMPDTAHAVIGGEPPARPGGSD